MGVFILLFLDLGMFSLNAYEMCALLYVYISKESKTKAKGKKILFAHLAPSAPEITFCISVLYNCGETKI